MFKKIILLSFIFFFNFINLFSEIIFRQAVGPDLDEISSLYFNILGTPDANNLVICPTLEMQRAKNAQEIESEQLFIARDMSTNSIVAVIKLYLLDTLNERDLGKIQNCLTQELCCEQEAFNFLQDIFQESIYFYYGGSFTKQEYREKTINTLLSNYAYNFLKQSALEKNRKYFILMYGQVQANIGHFGPYKAFGTFIETLGFCNPKISFKSFKSYKPIFIPNENGYKLVPDYINGLGQGCICLFDSAQ